MDSKTYSLAYRAKPLPAILKNFILTLSCLLLALETTYIICVGFAFTSFQITEEIVSMIPALTIAIVATTIILGTICLYALYIKWYIPTELPIVKLILSIGGVIIIQALGLIGAITLGVLIVCIIPAIKSTRLAKTQPSHQTDSTTRAIANVEKSEQSRNNTTATIITIIGVFNTIFILWWLIPLVDLAIHIISNGKIWQPTFTSFLIEEINFAISIFSVIILSSILLNKTKKLQKSERLHYLMAAVFASTPMIIILIAFTVEFILQNSYLN